jgi:hypothetical protein
VVPEVSYYCYGRAFDCVNITPEHLEGAGCQQFKSFFSADGSQSGFGDDIDYAGGKLVNAYLGKSFLL